MDARDWFVMIAVSAAWAAGTVFIFVFGTKEHAVELLAAWGTICVTMIGAYHWMVYKDSKVRDGSDSK